MFEGFFFLIENFFFIIETGVCMDVDENRALFAELNQGSKNIEIFFCFVWKMSLETDQWMDGWMDHHHHYWSSNNNDDDDCRIE